MICTIILDIFQGLEALNATSDHHWSSLIILYQTWPTSDHHQLISRSSPVWSQVFFRNSSDFFCNFLKSEVGLLAIFVQFQFFQLEIITATQNLGSELDFEETTSISFIETLCIHLYPQTTRWGPHTWTHLDDRVVRHYLCSSVHYLCSSVHSYISADLQLYLVAESSWILFNWWFFVASLPPTVVTIGALLCL